MNLEIFRFAQYDKRRGFASDFLCPARRFFLALRFALKAPSLAEGVWGRVNSGFCLKLPRTKTAKFATICHTEALAEVSTTHEVRFCL